MNGTSILQSSSYFSGERRCLFSGKSCCTLVYGYRCLNWVKKNFLPHSTLSFPMDSTAEEDHRMDWLKCVCIMEHTNGRFNNAKHIEIMSFTHCCYLYIYIYIYVCVCVCVCVHIYIYWIYMNTYLCMCLFMFLCLYVSVFLPVFINVYVCTYVYTYMCEFMCMSVCFYVYACTFDSVSVHSLRVIIPLSSLIFQGIHPQVPLTTSLVMFFLRSLCILGFSTSCTSTKVIQLVLISHQLVDRKLTAAKKKITKKFHEIFRKQLLWSIQSNVSPSNSFPIKKNGQEPRKCFPSK